MRDRRTLLRALPALTAALLVAACGRRGPLRLPEEKEDRGTRGRDGSGGGGY